MITLAEIGLIIANAWGWLRAHTGVILIIIIALVVIIGGGVFYSRCKGKPKFNEAEILKAQTAIQTQNHDAMVTVLAESDARVVSIDNSVNMAEQKTVEAVESAKQTYQNLDNNALAKEMEARAK